MTAAAIAAAVGPTVINMAGVNLSRTSDRTLTIALTMHLANTRAPQEQRTHSSGIMVALDIKMVCVVVVCVDICAYVGVCLSRLHVANCNIGARR